MDDPSVPILEALYDSGTLECSDVYLRIGLDHRAEVVRLRGLEPRSYEVTFGQTSFLEMVRRS